MSLKQKSRGCGKKTQASESSSTTCSTKLYDCDTQWNASMPYPTWPFGRVRGSELVKLSKKQASKFLAEHEEALL